ncbi:hypothetical protein A1359_07910 [Methylomonas lenta]|uniref:DUF3987 domain-containing protein n=1 Tax=Methylomonas lenta TaxID=980561 RepID=A0A177NFF7_9GAMM|nr:YfjI family protein [Methylomonas lenta]OAI16562.1 hypothetical protein A1359_07910 [Methylomonas lenta]
MSAFDDRIDEPGWQRPQSLTAKIEALPYPLDALPTTIREAVTEVHDFVKCPVSLVACSALAALSLSIQAHVDVRRANKLHGPAGLFMLSIAESGERKSTCDSFFTSEIRKYETEQAEASAPKIMEYFSEFAAWNAEKEGLLAAIRDSGKKGNSTQALREDLLELETQEPKAPRVPRLILGDETPEALSWSLAKKWPSSGVVSSEAGTVLGSHGIGTDSAMRNLALLNTLWDGGELSIGRKTSESFTVRGARLTVALQIQESTLKSFFDKSSGLARGTGFLARFLVAWPDSTQGSRSFTEAPDSWPKLEIFNQRIAEILKMDVPITAGGWLVPAMMEFTPDAKRLWIMFHDSLEAQLSAGGKLYDVRDVASKAADNAARLAALFQVFQHGKDSAIEADSFLAASKIVAWHLHESRRFFGELALPVELANAARLDSWLVEYCRRERTHLVGKSDCMQYGPLRTKKLLDEAITELCELDRLIVHKNGKRITLKVNPALLTVANANPANFAKDEVV